MPEVTPPLFVNVSSFYGADELGLPYRDLIGEGVLDYSDLLVVQRGAGANMSVDVGSGTAWIMGDTTPAAQPQYRVRSDSVVNLAIATAHGTLPRIDMVVAEVLDTEFDASGSRLWRLRVITGTATSGATLDNRTGAGAMPITAILLADVLVAALDTSITNAEIRSRRPFGAMGTIPPVLTLVNQVAFDPAPGLVVGADTASGATWIHASNDTEQLHALVYLPRRIVGATRLRWRYLQGSTAMAGNYIFIISDASGRPIVNTGSVAFAGAANTVQVRSETIAATTFEAGWYYLGFGVDSSAGAFTCRGMVARTNTTGGLSGPAINNTMIWFASGGVSFVIPLGTGADLAGDTTNSSVRPCVPLVALSVG